MTQEIRKPDFFIVGAPKCGTTAMADYLGKHPDIFMPTAKDSHFFGSDLDFKNNINHPPNLFRVTEQTYLSWFFSAGNQKRLGEASALYLYSKKAAVEIYEFNPNSQVIIMLRNPVDMIYSLHGQFLTDLNEDLFDFKDALGAEEDRKKGLRIPDTAYAIDALFYREVAKYTDQVQRYFDVFGKEKVHVIIFDDFENNIADTYENTLSFLGVKRISVPDFQVINPSKQLRYPAIQRFFINPPGVFMPAAQALSRILWFSKFVKKVLFLLNVKQERHSPMNPQLRKQLKAEFAPEVERLSQLLGRDLTYWSMG